MFYKKKMFTIGLNMGLITWACVKTTAYGVEIHWLSSKEKVPVAVFSVAGDADRVLRH